MNILISNDDGIQAEGIRRLAEALSVKGDVYVVAPDSQRSASSHALGLHNDLVLTEETDFPYAKKAWKMSGTPADCVKLGMEILRREGLETDIVYAGINHGANIGTDTMYSGTVSAAAEGLFAGIPAVAVSVCDHFPKHFEGACSLAVAVFEQALTMKESGSLLSLNAPDLPLSEIKGVRAAQLGTLRYHDWFEEPEPMVFRYSGGTVERPEQPADSDVCLTAEGYATIAVVKYNLNDYEMLKKINEWEITL